MTRLPLVSIITPTLNRSYYIDETIQSVLNQSYPHIEYIVIDGASKDCTLDILQGYDSQIQWISEPDNGQVDAINKGLSMASGDILAYINSDDYLVPRAIETIVKYFQLMPDAMFVYGDAIAINTTGRHFGKRHHVKQSSYKDLVESGCFIVQPASFWRRQVWDQCGGFNHKLNWVFDYEYFIRVSQYHRLHYIPQVLAYERIHSDAKTNIGGLKRIQELEKVNQMYDGGGIANNFRSEASATYIIDGVKRVLSGERSHGIRNLHIGIRINNSLIKLLIYLSAYIIVGKSSTGVLRLYSNWLRSKFRKKHMPSHTMDTHHQLFIETDTIEQIP